MERTGSPVDRIVRFLLPAPCLFSNHLDSHILLMHNASLIVRINLCSGPMSVLMIYNSPENIGDRNQAYAVSQVLARELVSCSGPCAIQIARIDARHKVQPLIPLLARMHILRILGPIGPAARIWQNLFPSDTSIHRKPSVIVSRLGKAEYASVALAEYFAVPNIHVGEPRRLPETLFSLIVSTSDTRESKNRIYLETVPSHLFPDQIQRDGKEIRRRIGAAGSTRIWTLLVGGDAEDFRYTDSDWRALGSFIRKAAKEHGITWLISTSRRTGSHVEELLRETIGNDGGIADATWWSREPRSTLAAYIGASDACVVTADSQSMISNCVAAARPVYAFTPAGATALNTEPVGSTTYVRIHQFLNRMQNNGRILIMRPEDCSDTSTLLRQTSSIRLVEKHERWDTRLSQRARELRLFDKHCP